MNEILKTNYADLEPLKILESPVSVLLGVSTKTADILSHTLNIKTVFDLAASHVFENASLIVETAKGGTTFLSKSGMIPSNVIDNTLLKTEIADFKDLMHKDILYLTGVGPHTAPLLKDSIDTETIRDLALWPPYLNARKVMAYITGEVKTSVNDGETPADLLPTNGQYPTERMQYNTLIFDRLLASEQLSPIEQGVKLDVMYAEESLARENTPAIGALLSYTQSWYTLGLTLGQLLHSLALAPGESTRIAVIDWYRRINAAATESGYESEALVSDIVRNRSLNEVVSAVAAEFQNGSAHTYSSAESDNFGFGFGYGTGTGSTGGGSYSTFSGLASVGDAMGLGFSYGNASGSGSAWTWSSSQGRRNIAADMAQRVIDQTHQSSIMARNRWASVVREVSQNEHETLSTRSVTNFNHMHALTIQYYEVIQLFRVVVELSKITRCLFVPMGQLDFYNDRVIKRFSAILANAALSPAVRLLASADLGSLFLKFPSSIPFSAKDQQYYFDWGNRNETRVNIVGDTVIIPDEGSNLYVEEFLIYNPEKSKPEDYVFESFILELQDGRSLEFSFKNLPNNVQSMKVADSFVPGFLLRLSEIKRILLRKSNGKKTFTGFHKNIDIVLGRTSEKQNRVLAGYNLDVPGTMEIFAAWNITPFDSKLWSEIKANLNANQLYYSQAVWKNMDSASLTHMLSTYSFAGMPLLNSIDSKPIGVAGCYLVFPLNIHDEDWTKYLKSTDLSVGTKQESIIPLPSGGVFAESVLGRSNGAEKLDITRFWNWSDSPIPIAAPDISALSSGSRANEAVEGIEPNGFGQPLINIVNPPALPDPQGLTAILTAIQNGNMFRDMSGLSGAISLVQSSLAEAAKAAQTAAGTATGEAQTAMAQAGKNLETAAKAFESVYGKGGTSGTSTSGSSSKAPSTISNLGAKYNAAEKLDKEQVQGQKGSGASSGTSGDSGKNTSSGTSSSRRDQVLGTEDSSTNADQLASNGSLPQGTQTKRAFLRTGVSDEEKLNKILALFGDTPLSSANEINYIFSILSNANSYLGWMQSRAGTLGISGGRWDVGNKRFNFNFSAEAEEAFKFMWNGVPFMYDRDSINLVEFLALDLATHIEGYGDYSIVSEGEREHTPLDYFFNAIPGKASYNMLGDNRKAGALFADSVFQDAHKELLPAQLTGWSTSDANWNGSDYSLTGAPTSISDPETLYIQQADFYKFRGRGYIQTTNRSNYASLARNIAENLDRIPGPMWGLVEAWGNVANDDALLDQCLSQSTNADWNSLFQMTDGVVAFLGVKTFSDAKQQCINMDASLDALSKSTAGTVAFLGNKINGYGTSLAQAVRKVIIEMYNSLS